MTPNIMVIVLNTAMIIILLTFHEWGHARAASFLGDQTAKENGRLSLNPAVHIDPVGTLILPILLQLGGGYFFGWAKPVPVDSRRLENPKRDMMLIAAAGPFMNIVLAFAIFLVQVLLASRVNPQIGKLIGIAGQVSVILAVFNLMPIHPLDGYSVLYGLLPYRYAQEFAKTGQYGFLILIGLLFLLPMLGISVFGWILWPVVQAIVSGLYQIVFWIL